MMAEQILWQTVVIRNLTDALSPDKKTTRIKHGKPSREKYEADLWFRHGGRDFYLVCHLAGIDPSWLREKYLAKEIDLSALKSEEKVNPESKRRRRKGASYEPVA